MIRKLHLLSVLSLLLLSVNSFAQENNSTEPTKKSFTNDDKKFNDWYVSFFVGANLLQNSDLVSWNYGHFLPGYDFQLLATREITHAFSVSFLIQTGKTFQYGEGPHIDYTGTWKGQTKYTGFSLLGGINLSQLFRRIDNPQPLRWAAHFYAGVGLITYETRRRSEGGPYTNWAVIDDVDLSEKSVYSQLGIGIRRKINPDFDVELKGMYFMSGDEEFDASGQPVPEKFTLADLEEGRDDNMVYFSLGVHYKLGRHNESLQWTDPLRNLVVIDSETALCPDSDGDGVCDFQDNCPDTPAGVKVDPTGCPFDTDGDGVPDSLDECPTIAGPPTNNGCPLPIIKADIETVIDRLNELIHGIEFDYNSHVIKTISYTKLNAVFDVLQSHPDYKFFVEAHTDATGTNEFNMDLSKRRADAVVRYLVNKGIPESHLEPVGKGESDLKFPECNPATNCPAWKNKENRRVVFKEFK